MNKPAYDTCALRRFLDEKLGGILAFDMVMACSRPENFRVVTKPGEKFLVKCVPPGTPGADRFRERFLPNLQDLVSFPEAVHIVGGPWEFDGHTVIVLSWCPGGRVMPDRVADSQWRELTRAYGQFSEAMQRTRAVLPVRDSLVERRQSLAVLDQMGCRFLHDFIQNELPEATLVYDPRRLKVIHGDFHHGNFHFDGGRVSGFMDFEEFRLGYPADDWVRYLIVGVEHLHWFDYAGRRRLLDAFSRLLPLAPADEWRLAVNAFLIRKIYRRFKKRRSVLTKLWWAQKIRFRLGFYRALQRRIAAYEVRSDDDN